MRPLEVGGAEFALFIHLVVKLGVVLCTCCYVKWTSSLLVPWISPISYGGRTGRVHGVEGTVGVPPCVIKFSFLTPIFQIYGEKKLYPIQNGGKERIFFKYNTVKHAKKYVGLLNLSD